MPEILSGAFAFWAGLLLGTCWAVLLWLQLPGQTPRPAGLSPAAGRFALAVSGGMAWFFWSRAFGGTSAFFCLGAWGMVLLCLIPIIWACLTTRHNSAA